MVDYRIIGENIRKYRKSAGLSQEQLAEAISISVTHMSHIETAATKLSLPVLAAIADVLDVSMDLLVYDGTSVPIGMQDSDYQRLFADCNRQERAILLESAENLKQTLRKHRNHAGLTSMPLSNK